MPARKPTAKQSVSSRCGQTTTRIRWNWQTRCTVSAPCSRGRGTLKRPKIICAQALKLQQALYGGSHPAIARTLEDLARDIADGGDLKSAIPLMQRAVAMQRELRGSEPHPDLADALNDMGMLLWRSGDIDGAEKFYRESLAMNRRVLGDKHPEIANGLENLAMSLKYKGDLAGAEILYRQSLEMRRELLGENHPMVGRTLLNLASLQYDRGATQEALANMRQVLAIYRKAYPADNPEIARVLNSIGSWLTMAGDYDDAGQYIKEGLAMRRRLFDAHQPDVASSLIALAILQNAEGKYPEAFESAQNAKNIYAAALSADHWRTGLAESAEGAALTGLGRYSEAEIRLSHGNGILDQGRWIAADLSRVGAALPGHFAPKRTARESGCRVTEDYSSRRLEAGSGRPLMLDIRRRGIRPRSHGIPDDIC